MPTSLATTAPTQFLDADGTRFAYRRFGSPTGTPVVFTQHFLGNLENFDPAISDGGSRMAILQEPGSETPPGYARDNLAGGVHCLKQCS
jgi:pimeloyl-ACP methyl ester carboxylesterase